LFDSVEERHQDEVHAAEEEARKKVTEANPGVDAEILKINFSEKVKQDDDRRKAANPGPRQIPVAARPPVEQQAIAQVYQNMGRFGV
jgi:TRIAD3 protein (E3 ubiquitin-protein ligase RNF216)